MTTSPVEDLRSLVARQRKSIAALREQVRRSRRLLIEAQQLLARRAEAPLPEPRRLLGRSSDPE